MGVLEIDPKYSFDKVAICDADRMVIPPKNNGGQK